MTADEPQPISIGERWEVWDVLNAAVVISFDSWSTFDPEGFAREIFKHYPRMAELRRTPVVKYEHEVMADNKGRIR